MSDNVRIDKWLWAARFFKTRSLAQEAVERGKVTLNGDKVKPARAVRVGDVLDIDNGSDRWEVDVMNLSEVRGPAPVARNLYEETDKGVQRRADDKQRRQLYREPSAEIKGRPTKRDRRQLGRFGAEE